LLAEFIGIKIFSLERSLGFEPLNFTLLSEEGLSFNMTAGVLLWPLVFVMTDLVNEYYGKRGVRMISFVTIGLVAYAFLMTFLAIQLTPADFWTVRTTNDGVINMDAAFKTIFGQGLWIIIGSLVAFLIGQLVDVTVFQYFKKITGSKKVWLRATGSTLVSQLIDSFVVLYIAFYWGAGWKLQTVLAICLVNYIYKSIAAIVLTPVLYWVHGWIDSYLGEELSEKLIRESTSY